MNEITGHFATSLVPRVNAPSGSALAEQKAEPPVPVNAGKALPPSGKSEPAAPPPVETKAAVEQLNQYLKESNRTLVFEIDKTRGRTIIRVVNSETQEVIREIPPDQLRSMVSAEPSSRLGLLDALI